MSKRKILYLSGTRADFGLMSSVLNLIDKHPGLNLSIYATGMHLAPEFGSTVKEVKKAFPQTSIINAGFSKTASTADFIAVLTPKLVTRIKKDRPDLVIVLGDRSEMLLMAMVCSYLRIPVAHIHGGDKTTTIDENVRHSITKLSHLHFAATKDAAERAKKLGEESWRIIQSGAPSIDTILNRKLPAREDVYKFLDIKQGFILLLQHPVSDQIGKAGVQMEETIRAVKSFNFPAVTIYPNADEGGFEIIKAIEAQRSNPNFKIFPSVNYGMFLGLVRECLVWVGNSSGGIIESASFHTPVVNVGDRQKGRPQSGNVLNVGYNKSEIIKAIEKSLLDKEYLNKVSRVKNIWGDGKAAERIVKILSEIKMDDKLLNKQITY